MILVCPKCGKGQRKRYLPRHLRRVHGVEKAVAMAAAREAAKAALENDQPEETG